MLSGLNAVKFHPFARLPEFLLGNGRVCGADVPEVQEGMRGPGGDGKNWRLPLVLAGLAIAATVLRTFFRADSPKTVVATPRCLAPAFAAIIFGFCVAAPLGCPT